MTAAPMLPLSKSSAPVLRLEKSTAFKKLSIVVEWAMMPGFEHLMQEAMTAEQKKKSFDLDIGLLCLTESGELLSADDIVYWDRKTLPGLTLPEDNQVGGQEIAVAELDKVKKSRIAVICWIHKAAVRGHDFSKVKSASLTLLAGNEVIQSYNISAMNGTLLYAGEIARSENADEWEFEPNGETVVGDLNTAIAKYWGG